MHKVVHDLGREVKDRISAQDDGQQGQPPQAAYSGQQQPGPQEPGTAPEFHSRNRYDSFAPQRHGNDVKWYVDGVSIRILRPPTVTVC